MDGRIYTGLIQREEERKGKGVAMGNSEFRVEIVIKKVYRCEEIK